MRIYYFYPTRTSPAGGIKQIRLTVALLNRLGAEATLLRQQRYWDDRTLDDAALYELDTPIAPFSFENAREHLTPDDVVVLPEVGLFRTLPQVASWNVRIGLNTQNGFAAIRDRPLERRILSRIEFAVSNAPYVSRICHQVLRIPWSRIYFVPHWILRSPFVLQDLLSGASLSVAYMPRKIPHISEAIRGKVLQMEPDVPWVPIDMKPESEVVQLMRSSKIFFAAQHLEGCPMPALEAMACGTLVAGFKGTRGLPHPYATALNGFWAPDDSIAAGVKAVCSAISVARENGDEFRNRVSAGRHTLKQFSEAAVLDALKSLLRAIGAQQFVDSRNPSPSIGLRGQWEILSRKYSRAWLRTRLGHHKRRLLGRASARPDLA